MVATTYTEIVNIYKSVRFFPFITVTYSLGPLFKYIEFFFKCGILHINKLRMKNVMLKRKKKILLLCLPPFSPQVSVPLFLPPFFATSFLPHPTLLVYQHKLKGGLCPEAAVWEGQNEPAQGKAKDGDGSCGELSLQSCALPFLILTIRDILQIGLHTSLHVLS